MRSTAACEITGPMSSPSLILRVMAAIWSTMAWTSPTPIISEAAMQRWPAQP
jgi:hypothetical protein